jgi:dTDP-glucose 4,6-dehydratase
MFLCPSEDLQYAEDQLGSLVDNLRGVTIFLAGSTGFIGKSLIESLVWLNRSKNLNLEIHSVSRNPEKFFALYPHFKDYLEFHLLKGDIRDQRMSFEGRTIDMMIHAAADVIAETRPEDLFDSCVRGTENLIEFAIQQSCKKFLLLSSGAIYGKLPKDMDSFPESFQGGIDLSSPKSAYALGKQASEWITQQKTEQMDVMIARCFAFVGPYLPIDSHFAIGNFMRDVMANRDIEINGDGTPLRTYLYTSDLCVWLLKILLSGQSGDVFNVGGNEVISIAKLADLVNRMNTSKVNIHIHQTSKDKLTDAYIPNIDKISTKLGLYPGVNLKMAVQKTLNWNQAYGNFH